MYRAENGPTGRRAALWPQLKRGTSMDRENGSDGDNREPWVGLVSDAAPCDHIVQLYQDQDFLNRAVCRFAGAALANGEGLILVPTLTHWNAFPTPRGRGGGRGSGTGTRTADDR